MFWDLFKRKKKGVKAPESMEPITKQSLEHIVVDKCEQMMKLSTENEETQEEYRRVTNYLNDIQTLEDLEEEEKKALLETAFNIDAMNSTVEEYLKAEKKISEAQFRQMQELEDEVPGAIKGLKENEALLEKINKDMGYLESEKLEWQLFKQDANEHLASMHKVNIFVLLIVVSFMFLVLIANLILQMDTRLWLVFALFLVTLYVVYYLVKLQDDQRDIKKANAYINRAISLENHVKIKYVNMKNAVDYTCEKFHVRNAKDFEYVWDCYNEAVREHAKYKQNSEDLEYFQEKLIRQLKKYHLYDTAIWLKNTKALIDKREMVEVKHELLARRKKLRDQIAYNNESIQVLKSEVEKDLPKMKAGSEKVEAILKHFA